MTSPQPSWADPSRTSTVPEPFRSDGDFWTGLAASADTALALVVAAVVSVSLVLAGQQLWFAVPFAVPCCLALRAARVGQASSRRSREAFADDKQWREAERAAVAASFRHALLRPRRTSAPRA